MAVKSLIYILTEFMLICAVKCLISCDDNPDISGKCLCRLFIYKRMSLAHHSPVSLSLTTDERLCPLNEVTARCIVKKHDEETILNWECDDKDGAGTLLCSTVHVLDDSFSCSFGKVYNVTNECDCSDSVMISSVTFLVPRAGSNETIGCSNGAGGASRSIPISTLGIYKQYMQHAHNTQTCFILFTELDTPKINAVNYTRRDGDQCDLTIGWSTMDAGTDDIEYILTMSGLTSKTNTLVKYATMTSVTLRASEYYLISVMSQRCDGILTSASNVVTAYCPGETLPRCCNNKPLITFFSLHSGKYLRSLT